MTKRTFAWFAALFGAKKPPHDLPFLYRFTHTSGDVTESRNVQELAIPFIGRFEKEGVWKVYCGVWIDATSDDVWRSIANYLKSCQRNPCIVVDLKVIFKT
jgi:hypothetical protein